MKILHVYDESDSMAARYVNMLTTAAGSLATMRHATTSTAFKILAAEFSPDIVHVHAVPKFSITDKYRVVITPHGHPLFPQPAYAVIARSQQEKDILSTFAHRIEVVRNPIITRTTTPDTCVRQMLRIYRKVMDSFVVQLMNEATRSVMAQLLAAAIGGDRHWADERHVARMLPDCDFHLLYIYAQHENILAYIDRGIDILHIEAPQRTATDSYLPADYLQPKPMSGSVIDIVADIKTNGPSLLRLAELSETLRSDCLDEDVLRSQLEDRHQLSLFQSILYLAQAQTLLPEGFMPSLPANDSVAQQLAQHLFNRQNVIK